MFTSLLKHRPMRESGFTMIELLVAVVIIAILAAIAVPVYLNLKTEAAKSALKSDVNTAVKKVSIALTNDVPLATILADTTGAYIPQNLPRGEVISLVQATGGTTTAAFITDTDSSDGGYVVRSATYSGASDGVAHAKTAAATAGPTFFVYGVLAKTQGAPVDYSYSYTSVANKFSQGVGGGSVTPSAPAFTTTSLPDATQSKAYSATVAATGNPGVTFSGATVNGLSIASNGAISGSPDTTGTTTLNVTATNDVGSVTKAYAVTVTSGVYLATSEDGDPTNSAWSNANTRVSGAGYASSYGRVLQWPYATDRVSLRVPTTAGQSYTLKAWVSMSGYHSNAGYNYGASSITANGAGVSSPPSGYSQKTLVFTGSAGQAYTDVTFAIDNGGSYGGQSMLVDTVSVQAN